MAELKKCPFCGGEAEARKEIGGIHWRVKCLQCSAEVGRYWFGSKNQAVIAWNHRTVTEVEIRAKAIDEFAEKLGHKILFELDDCAEELDWIEEIAEQLKWE